MVDVQLAALQREVGIIAARTGVEVTVMPNRRYQHWTDWLYGRRFIIVMPHACVGSYRFHRALAFLRGLQTGLNVATRMTQTKLDTVTIQDAHA